MRDNHPKRRQLRRVQRHLRRKKGTRAGLPAFLIICEGRETEPNYLNGFCDAEGINRANVTVIAGDEETDALRLVRKAQRRFETDRDFDAVFVVCDCADERLAAAYALASRPMKHITGRWITIDLIVSRPCIELWLLLHFEYVSRPFPSAASVIDMLRRHVTEYNKADWDIFAKVQAGLDRAIVNAARLKLELAATGAQSPDTDMPRLIEKLRTLRRRGIGPPP